MKGVNLFRVGQCMRLWNFHNATPLYSSWYKILRNNQQKDVIITIMLNKIVFKTKNFNIDEQGYCIMVNM
jgi:hypothetical protein